ncbi:MULTISPECIES: DUF805 domain-containing protein [Cellulophaga]|uniref:DUF805 domain-containing protein n=1 Tax=Cellulophaga TaxID=104264 RepID=UPI0003FFD5D2|nr:MULTISPECIES: DUF805 domain-containing protein [Cellulophaga]KGK30348.1 membrane protein [Cellulophaga sp. E6(2014)]MBA6316644.1 DUF805 domain-containing protein [Cellulophaga baltica]MCR1026486.1 DUF805 domain-containing protein [Cellulophaga baltica]
MKWYLDALKKYAQFDGRSRRQEYWMFRLFSVLFMFAALVIDFLIAMLADIPLFIFTPLYILAIILPSIAITVRRLHDTNNSGWMFLVGFIPFVGAIWLLVLEVTEGTHGPNDYGEDPKEIRELIQSH